MLSLTLFNLIINWKSKTNEYSTYKTPNSLELLVRRNQIARSGTCIQFFYQIESIKRILIIVVVISNHPSMITHTSKLTNSVSIVIPSTISYFISFHHQDKENHVHEHAICEFNNFRFSPLETSNSSSFIENQIAQRETNIRCSIRRRGYKRHSTLNMMGSIFKPW